MIVLLGFGCRGADMGATDPVRKSSVLAATEVAPAPAPEPERKLKSEIKGKKLDRRKV